MPPLKTGKDYREASKERQRRWRQGLLEKGYKFLNVPMSPEAQAIINREREQTGETAASVIERALRSVTSNARLDQTSKVETGATDNATRKAKAKPEEMAKADAVIKHNMELAIKAGQKHMPNTATAEELNRMGIRASRGGTWRESSVRSRWATIQKAEKG